MKYEAIIFDFGDTLAGLKPSAENILQNYLKTKNKSIPIKDIKLAYRITDYIFKQSEIINITLKDKKDYLISYNKNLLKVLGLSSHSTKWANDIFNYFKKEKHWTLFPEIESTLKKLIKLNYKLYVLSNWDYGLNKLLKKTGIFNYFTKIYISKELQLEKPDPAIFKYVLKDINIIAEKALYVGNEYEADIIGARKVNITPILIDRNNYYKNADCLHFNKINEIINLLNNDT